jgi:hypothetical protein
MLPCSLPLSDGSDFDFSAVVLHAASVFADGRLRLLHENHDAPVKGPSSFPPRPLISRGSPR